MKILISSHFFAPSVGGTEQVSEILAVEFAALGHEVRVITTTPAVAEPPDRPFAVFRNPSKSALVGLVRWCDVYFQSNISLNTLWPAWVLDRPVVVTYHTWLTQPDGRLSWREHLKRVVARRVARNLGVSQAIARSVSADCGVIANPFRDDLFAHDPAVTKDRDLVFLGRLVSDKGVDTLIEALRWTKASVTLSIIGKGPEEPVLRALVEQAGLEARVAFLGKHTGAALVRQLNRHRVMVIPSRLAEPFGLVALEGIACGLAAIGSRGGGLGDAIGPCGSLFDNGDARMLATQIDAMISDDTLRARHLSFAPAHLARYGRRRVAQEYLAHFTEVIRSRAPATNRRVKVL